MLVVVAFVFFFTFNSTYVPVPRKIKVRKEKVSSACLLSFSSGPSVDHLPLWETARIQGSL